MLHKASVPLINAGRKWTAKPRNICFYPRGLPFLTAPSSPEFTSVGLFPLHPEESFKKINK